MDNLKLIEGSIYYNNGCNFENYTGGICLKFSYVNLWKI